MTGCAAETRYRVLSAVFDGVPAPGEERPPRRRRGRPPAPIRTVALPPEPLPAPIHEPGPSYETFAELQAAFPKDAMGNVDWVAAAREGLVEPRPGIDPDTQDIPPMPLDVRLDPGVPQLEVIFPHEAHTFWLRCDNCHPSIFQMRAGTAPITMGAIFQGEYCGRCHGKVAFAPATGCIRCHRKLGGPGA